MEEFIDKKKRQCDGKVAYRSPRLAEQSMAEQSYKSPHFVAYTCPHCLLWHIGHNHTPPHPKGGG